MIRNFEPSLKYKVTVLILIGTLLLTGIPGCSFAELIVPTTEAPTSNEETQEPVTEALVTFFVKTPVNTPPQQPILMSVLDEVTGLALNAKRYTMEASGDGEYSVVIPFPVGTTVKYRYSRQGDILAEEHTTDGRAVRYRMYQVEAPGEVHDVISRWNDTSFEGLTGRISGTAIDAITGTAIPGLLVTAGGSQVYTAGDGTFYIEGLPPGVHNIVVYAIDGSYKTRQQGALVATQSTTPATMQLTPTSNVDITFILHVPEDTPPIVPIRLAGNLYQLGNTFADLSGGISTLASRMPDLSALPDGSYGVILSLPKGADIQYKYSLGDGFWNTERATNGDWVIRQLIVPDKPTVIQDTIQTWRVGDSAPITFDLSVPGYTPPDESIYIQFNPYGWTEPLPMWHLGDKRWAYILYSPLDMLEKLGYRYCRAGQCGHADDARTPGVFTSGQIVQTAENPQGVPDHIDAWAWLEIETQNTEDLTQIVVEDPPGLDFMAGVEFQERFHPSWIPRLPSALEDVTSMGANWLILTPSWTFTRPDPPILEPVAGQDPLWLDTTAFIRQGKRAGLNLAMRPVAHFPTQVDEWWRSAPRDFPWWVSWFDRYTAFALHFADMAEQNGVQTLILGGDWMSPALPGGQLGDGSPSGVPPDADLRYRELIEKVRERFSGRLGWALSYPEDTLEPPGFIETVDLLYILWSVPLSEETNPTLEEMEATAESLLSTDLYAMWLTSQLESETKEIIISLAYASIEGGTTGCLADPILGCILPESLNYPAPDFPLLGVDLAIQARVYNAMLSAISHYPWINGVTTRGYYPPVILQDKSTSIHGKPAEEVMKAWVEAFLRSGDE
jgi:hypothetical protein